MGSSSLTRCWERRGKAVADLVPGRVDRAWIGLGGDHVEHAGDHVRGGKLLLACQPVDPLRHGRAWLGSGGYGALLTAVGAGGLVSTVVSGPLATGKHVSVIVIGARLVRAPHAVPRSRTSARC